MGRHPLALTALIWVAVSVAPAQQPLSPADAVAAAVRDARTLPADVRTYTRYLSLHYLPEAQREAAWRILSLHSNSLSTEADVLVPTIVPQTGASLARINLLDYGWTPALWDQLADPHFTVLLETKTPHVATWPGGVWPDDGKHYPAGSFTYYPRVRKRALAPWLSTAEAAELVNLTQASVPVVHAGWFVWQTAIQADRTPGYYDFLGVKDKQTFDALVGYDAKLQQASKRVELLEAVAVSTVTLQPRRIGAFPAINGLYWQTFDSRLAVDAHNPLRILNGGLQFDAQEVFGHLPNGLLVWGLFDSKGVRQDAAPDFIASDATAPGTDRRVHAGLSCVRCHLPHAGINPVDGWARNLFQGDLKLQAVEYAKLKELRQKYLRDLGGAMEDSRRVYTRAIAEATGGLKPADAGTAYGQFFAAYDGAVSLERAAADAGVTPARLTAALKGYLLQTGNLDPVAAVFLSARRGGIPVTSYHEILPQLHVALRGTKP